MEYAFLECKQNVSAGIDILMSISFGLGPYNFGRKMEKARPMKEEMDGKFVCFPPRVGIFNFDVIIRKALFLICTLTWRVNIYVSHHERFIQSKRKTFAPVAFESKIIFPAQLKK